MVVVVVLLLLVLLLLLLVLVLVLLVLVLVSVSVLLLVVVMLLLLYAILERMQAILQVLLLPKSPPRPPLPPSGHKCSFRELTVVHKEWLRLDALAWCTGNGELPGHCS